MTRNSNEHSGSKRLAFVVAPLSSPALSQEKKREPDHLLDVQPLEKYFAPAALGVAGKPVAATDYPSPIEKTLGFNGKPLSRYENYTKAVANTLRNLTLSVQACSDEICLKPEELSFNFPGN